MTEEKIIWVCTRCETVLDGNPRLCPACGYTVYRPTSTEDQRHRSATPSRFEMTEISDHMIYAYAGEPEITATDAHCIRDGLERAINAMTDEDVRELYLSRFVVRMEAARAESVRAYQVSPDVEDSP